MNRAQINWTYLVPFLDLPICAVLKMCPKGCKGNAGNPGQSDVWLWQCIDYLVRGYYLETDPDPIAMVIRVELVIHKPTETNPN